MPTAPYGYPHRLREAIPGFRVKPLLMGAIAALTGVGCASVERGPQAHWQGLARADLQAAHTTLLEDHPGMARQTADRQFIEREGQAFKKAVRRAGAVRDIEGYMATLTGYANDLHDRHIGFNFTYRSDTRHWAGIIPSLRNGEYIVRSGRPGQDAESLIGAKITACDGQPIDDFARARLGEFRANWSIRAQRERSAPLLLVDDGNPFLPRASRCVFERDGVATEVALDWQPISRTELSPLVAQAINSGQAGFGLRPFQGGYWIALEAFDERAEPVVEQARLQAGALLAAPRVVIDLRGNGGGDDVYGRKLANLLFGRARVEAMVGPDGMNPDCPSVWRASARNAARLEELSHLIKDSQTLEVIASARSAIDRARNTGNELSGSPTCETTRVASAEVPAKAAKGTVILLTDNACFSSCLSVTRLFKQLGAVQLGQATNANTHYSEVRGDRLPSGLATFFTLQALIPDAPLQYGPFEPDVAYDGSLADTGALEALIARLDLDAAAGR